MNDLQNPANALLTDGGTSAPNVEPSEPVAAGPLPGADEAPVGQPGAPPPAPGASADLFAATPWLRPDDGPELRTELQDLTVCKSCNAPVPVGAASCPQCKKFTSYNRGRKSRKCDVEKIFDNLLREYQPATTVLKETCEHLARAYGELKTMPAGSLEWQRILNITQELSVSLEASRPKATDEDYESMPEPEMVARVTRLLSMLFIARDEPGQDAMLRDLLHVLLRPWAAHRQGEIRRNIRQFCDEYERGLLVTQPADEPVPVFHAPPNTRIDGDGLILLEPGDVGYVETPAKTTPPKPPSESQCTWCHQTLTRCAEIKATRLDNWDALHSQDPEHVAERDKRATAEMYESMRRARTGGIPQW